MSVPISIRAASDPARARAALAAPLSFGHTLADLMVRVLHDTEQGWHDAAIVPLAPIELSPAAKVLHYGLEIFEGHKAYRWPAGEVALFRADLNAARFNASARRMGMPEIPTELQLELTERLVDLLRGWVPAEPGSALYLRPTMIATEPAIGVGPSSAHLYFLIASPVGPYFAGALERGVSVLVEEEQIRAARGGTGAAKTGGNYAAGIPAQQRAKNAGYDQVLWLDALERRYVEELNAMNLFVVDGGRVLTPPTGGTILDGITRRSVLELAPDLGIVAAEERIAIDELVRGVESGRVTELFAAGTAAVISPIGALGYRGRRLTVGSGAWPVARRIHDALTGIQYGRAPDPRRWTRPVPRRAA